MKIPKITINKISGHHKIYVYRSTNPNDINTIDKIRIIHPVFIIDEANTTGQEQYELLDSTDATQILGVTYLGPNPNSVPCNEYESEVEIGKINDFDYFNIFILKPLEAKFNGVMLYYTSIGVDEDNNTITNLSHQKGLLVDNEYKTIGIRKLYYSEDETDNWTYICDLNWDEENIRIGDINDTFKYEKIGSPFVDTVPPISEINYSTRNVISNNYMDLEIQNPWVLNNKEFNFRKLKRFSVRNVIVDNFSIFSEPNFQSLLPVSIEKMVIAITTNSTDVTPEDLGREDISIYQVIKRHGIFYNHSEHKHLGLNRYDIDLGETIAVFNESSKQGFIKFKVPVEQGNTYYITVFLIDIYNNWSEPFKKEIEL